MCLSLSHNLIWLLTPVFIAGKQSSSHFTGDSVPVGLSSSIPRQRQRSSPPLSSFFVLGAGEGVYESPAHQLPLLKAAATGPAGSLSSPCSLASCCDCWCHQSQLTKYMWSLNVLLVLTQDISRSARSQPHGAQQIHRCSLAPPLASFNVPCPTSLPFPPHHPANPHPSEPRLFLAVCPGCQSTPNRILLCSIPAADPTWTTHHAQDSGRLWASSHVSHWRTLSCPPTFQDWAPSCAPYGEAKGVVFFILSGIL